MNTSKNNKKILKYILVLVWMIIIFKFSSDPAEISDGKSGFIIEVINSLGINISSTLGEFTNFAIRKTAHVGEYFILTLLLISALKEDLKIEKTYWLSILVTFLYACSDEIHQRFVPGRAGRFSDVLIDLFGGILAVFIVKLFKNFKNR
ncbi:VanZ family protein [Clostridium cochlearium]|uniref:VanZ family protein n=1 Tax=Clostridium cochlearium TaxID=1494 RepID=UPI000B94ADFE|nr:VanZ family protein [Clostridium cochlearium]MBU5269922.1 VanZ family protein [Clostridium cochlearium]MCG4571339.1 VanZ family protein [Clostridium cochlearium]MCG4580612.1 VanZ family protein [Clostridium cochlearium]MCR1972389.1 VanZ family protein [Clostridium cochlearium]SNV68196.1 acetobutylicum phosphotransbutyrylase [Clostridium cochlearium]